MIEWSLDPKSRNKMADGGELFCSGRMHYINIQLFCATYSTREGKQWTNLNLIAFLWLFWGQRTFQVNVVHSVSYIYIYIYIVNLQNPIKDGPQVSGAVRNKLCSSFLFLWHVVHLVFEGLFANHGIGRQRDSALKKPRGIYWSLVLRT